jgi:hypothetical protein
MTSILTSLLVVFEAMTLSVCCVIETALAKQTSISYQLLLSIAEIESQIMLNELEEKNRK